MTNEAEMVEFEQDRKMVVRLVDAPFPARIVIAFLPRDGGTRLDWTATFEPRGWLRPAAPLLAAFYRRAFQPDLDRLKTLMEAHQL